MTDNEIIKAYDMRNRLNEMSDSKDVRCNGGKND